MTRAINKITFQWTSTEVNPEIVNDPTWVIDPVFDNEEFAMSISPTKWIFTSTNQINTPGPEAYAAIILQEQKDYVWEQIKAERDRRKTEGGYKVGNYWYHSDTFSRTQQIGLVMIGQNLPANLMWKTMSGEFVNMTPSLAAQVFQAAVTSDVTIHAIAEQKRQAANESSDPLSIDVMSGWPKIYGE